MFCRKLYTLRISFDRYSRDTTNKFSFQLLKNCNHLEQLSISGVDGRGIKGGKSKFNISAKILDIDGLQALKKLKFISLGEVEISSDSEVFIIK